MYCVAFTAISHVDECIYRQILTVLANTHAEVCKFDRHGFCIWDSICNDGRDAQLSARFDYPHRYFTSVGYKDLIYRHG